MLGRLLGDLLVVVAAETGLALAVDGEDHCADVAFAEIGRGFGDRRRPVPAGPEIFLHPGLEFLITVVGMGAARLLGMGMDIDGGDGFRIEHGGGNSSLRGRNRSRQSGCRHQRLDAFDVGRIPGDVQIVHPLEIQPVFGRRAERLADAQRRIGCNGPAAVNDFVDPARRDVDGRGQAILADLEFLEKFRQMLARMNRFGYSTWGASV